MPKVFENEITFDYSPVHVLANVFKKYPNPYATHVQSVDTISRTVNPDTGIIRSERLLGVVQGAPKWVAKLFHLPPTAYVREVIFIDPKIPSATAMSVNLSLAQYIACLELITYTPDPPPATVTEPPKREESPSFFSFLDSPEEAPPPPGYLAQTTLFRQRAYFVSAFPTAMIARRVEKASVDRFAANAGVGRRGFNWVLAGGLDLPANGNKKK